VLGKEPVDRAPVAVVEVVETDQVGVAAAGERTTLVEYVGDAAAHAGGEVAAGLAQDHDPAAGHVLAAVVADPLDHRVGAGVAYGEPLAGLAAEERSAARRPVEDRVAGDHVVFGDERRPVGWADGQDPTGQAPYRCSHWPPRTG
jgi:hypothetical protein